MTKLTRRALLISPVGAAMAFAPPAVAATGNSPVDEPVKNFYDALEAAMKAGQTTPFVKRFDALAPVVDRVFDLETVLKVSVGMRWDTLDGEMRKRLLKAYRTFTVATYVANFDKFDGERLQVVPGSRTAGSNRIVDTEIISPGGQRLPMDYVMHEDHGQWRAVDVLVQGSISRVAVQRSDFRKILSAGNAEALIVSLRRKTRDLSDGALS